MELIHFILAAYGLTFILLYGSLFNSIRPTKGKWGELFQCPLCVGFWFGIFFWSINGGTELFTFEYNFINLLILGCGASGTSYILCTIFGDEGFKHELLRKKDY